MPLSQQDNIANMLGCFKHGFTPSSSLWQPFIYVGPEIELESVYLFPIKNSQLQYWSITDDGSLRNSGKELKAKFPIAGKDIVRALHELAVLKKRYFRTTPTFSVRTGTHYHINISNMSTEEVMNSFMWYMLYEPVFYSLGRIKFDRSINTYCQPVILQPSIEALFMRFITGNSRGFIRDCLELVPKYCSMHINPSFGTMEFRSFDATISPTKHLQWINIITEFVVNSSNTPFNYNDIDIKKSAKKIFGRGYDQVKKFIPNTIPSIFTEYFGKDFRDDVSTPIDLEVIYNNIFKFEEEKKPIRRNKPSFLYVGVNPQNSLGIMLDALSSSETPEINE